MTREKHPNNTIIATRGTTPDIEPEPLSTKQLRTRVAQALAFLESQGIRDWEILEAWSGLSWRAGNHKAMRVLERAARELKEAKRSQEVKTSIEIKND
jgi:hypothetical protein